MPEMNLGQLAALIRARFLVDAIAYNQVRGLPFPPPSWRACSRTS